MRPLSGVGIGLRRPHYEGILATERVIDWLEYVPENFIGQGGFRARAFDACRERYSLVPHGVSLSVGGPDPLDWEYLRGLKELINRTNAPFFSDHVCFSSAHGIRFHDLLPLPFTEEAASYAARRAREVMDFVERPLLLENITYYARMPASQLSEGEFLSRLLEESGAGLLLDVNNVWVNAKNHGLDPAVALRELPLERTLQIHLAGHVQEGDLLLDNHGAPVSSGVWQLYQLALTLVGPVPTLLEWDTDIPSLDRLLDEADHARALGALG